MTTPGLNLYLLFVASWFLHLPARIPALGAVRFDLMLVIVLTVIALTRRSGGEKSKHPVEKLLRALIIYSIVTIPFVEWPGSVIKFGLPNFIKAIVFFYFTVAYVRSEKELARFIFVFVLCQVIRVAEPLYLHLTEGYWGSQASMSGGTEFLGRLSGSPSDTVNPNGLAFIVCTLLPFLYFMKVLSWKHMIVFLVVTPMLLYALLLTGSRSGLVALVVVYVAILVKSRRRTWLVATGIAALMVGISIMPPDMKDRYLSIVGMGQKNLETADERVEGMKEQLEVVIHRPVFGHGLGTSPEANYHFTDAGPYGGWNLPAHNLYLEIAQELGVVGLLIFLSFMVAILHSFRSGRRVYSAAAGSPFLVSLVDAMQVWIIMNIVFSFASYGLSSYDWYLFGGLSIVIQKIRSNAVDEAGRAALPIDPAPTARRSAVPVDSLQLK